MGWKTKLYMSGTFTCDKSFPEVEMETPLQRDRRRKRGGTAVADGLRGITWFRMGLWHKFPRKTETRVEWHGGRHSAAPSVLHLHPTIGREDLRGSVAGEVRGHWCSYWRRNTGDTFRGRRWTKWHRESVQDGATEIQFLRSFLIQGSWTRER